MKFQLLKTDNNELENYKAKASVREYEFWELRSVK
jgi:hypothetical protein